MEWFNLQWLYTFTFEAETMPNLGLQGTPIEKQIAHTVEIMTKLAKGSAENPKISNQHSFSDFKAMLEKVRSSEKFMSKNYQMMQSMDALSMMAAGVPSPQMFMQMQGMPQMMPAMAMMGQQSPGGAPPA